MHVCACVGMHISTCQNRARQPNPLPEFLRVVHRSSMLASGKYVCTVARSERSRCMRCSSSMHADSAQSLPLRKSFLCKLRVKSTSGRCICASFLLCFYARIRIQFTLCSSNAFSLHCTLEAKNRVQAYSKKVRANKACCMHVCGSPPVPRFRMHLFVPSCIESSNRQGGRISQPQMHHRNMLCNIPQKIPIAGGSKFFCPVPACAHMAKQCMRQLFAKAMHSTGCEEAEYLGCSQEALHAVSLQKDPIAGGSCPAPAACAQRKTGLSVHMLCLSAAVSLSAGQSRRRHGCAQRIRDFLGAKKYSDA